MNTQNISLLKPYTNNDKINDMTVEEKAKFLDEMPWCELKCSKSESCYTCILEYLKKEDAK